MRTSHRLAMSVALASLLGAGWTGIAMVQAQEGDLPPEAAGPGAEQIKAFESEFGGPPSSLVDDEAAGPPKIEYEKPGQVDETAKKYANEQELVAIYCAYTKWKGGRFLAAMDAVKKNLIPAVEKAKTLGIEVAMPDPDSLKAEGSRRIEAVCAAGSVAAAESLIADFEKWGESEAARGFDSVRTKIQEQTKAKGDALKAKIKADLDPYVESEKARIQAALKAEAERLAEAEKANFMSAGAPPTPEALEAVKNRIKSQLQSSVDRYKAEIQANIKTKVDALVGDSKAKFEAVGAAFEGMQAKIDADIAAGSKQYETFRTDAFELRKSIVLKTVDKNIEEKMKELDSAAADLEEAKKSDSSVMTAAEIKAAVQADRAALEGKLDAALASGDENAFQGALNAFRQKWVTYRAEAEKSVAGSMSKVCAIVATEFAKAKPQIESGVSQVDTLLSTCASDGSERCLKVNGFAPRLGTLKQKMGDIKLGIATAEAMCADTANADAKQLGALLKKVQADAEDLRTFGQALEADKEKVIADTGAKMCDQALAQLAAAKKELEGSDVAALKADSKRCTGKIPASLADFCKKAGEVKAEQDKVLKQVTEFGQNIATVEKLCAGPQDESALERIGAALNSLKADGDALRTSAKGLRAEVEAKLSEKMFCRAALGVLDEARSRVSAGLATMTEQRSRCKGAEAARSATCGKIATMQPKITAIETKAKEMLTRMSALQARCGKAGSGLPAEDMIESMEKLRSEADSFKAEAEALKAEAEKAEADSGEVWIEAESAARFNVRTKVDDPMAREVNPSWRPSYFGSGSWYMGRGGDFLEYDINVPADGKYNLWIRDLSSAIVSQQGKRSITFYFDGKSVGVFTENTSGRGVRYPKGAFRWHKATAVQLTAGTHKMRVVKSATTNGAAILDAFYLTTTDKAPSER